MQAQTIARRLEEAIAIWDELDRLVAHSALPDRVTAQLYDAVLGYRLRRCTYAKATDTEERTASRDLGRLVDLGILVPRGEARGRHYIAGAILADLRHMCQERRRPLNDPFPWMRERLSSTPAALASQRRIPLIPPDLPVVPSTSGDIDIAPSVESVPPAGILHYRHQGTM